MAPCQDYVSREEYRAHVDKALEFLNGNYNMILNDLQKKMEEAQAKLAEQELTGTSGGGMVKITLNGKFEMKKVEIDKSMLEEEDVSILEDMIAAAYNDAHAKVDASMAEGMKDVTGGLNLGGLKLPF